MRDEPELLIIVTDHRTATTPVEVFVAETMSTMIVIPFAVVIEEDAKTSSFRPFNATTVPTVAAPVLLRNARLPICEFQRLGSGRLF